MAANYSLLQTSRVNTIINALQDPRTIPQQLKFLQRTPVVPAVDSEILARFIGYVTVADLVADDQKATVYQQGKLSLESNVIPNIKHGSIMTQAMLNQLRSISQNTGITNDQVGLWSNYENMTIQNLLTGIRQRMEALIVAMQLDTLTYNRLGIQINGASWGMPSDLKTTTAVTWDTAASATPISDILTQRLYAQTRYGENYNRVTMSTTAFRYMIATTEFLNKVRFVINPSLSPAQTFPQQMIGQMRQLAMNLLDMEIELYDARYWTQGGDASFSNQPYLPITKVILSDSGDDNNAMVMDFANGVTDESIVADMAPMQFGGFGGPQYGPISYVTANSDLNPPQLTYWGVARGFPRKKRLQATSVLTVGTFADIVPVGPPLL